MLAFYVQLLDDPDLRDQLEKAYYKYRGLMFAIAKKIVKEDSLAEDAVHETFVRIAPKFSKVSRLRPNQMEKYFFIATRNVSLNMVRDRKHEISTDQSELEDRMEPAEDVLDEITARVSVEELAGALDQLSVKLRDALYLYSVCEMSQKDIAELLQISEAAVSKRVQRGRRQLSLLLQKRQPEASGENASPQQALKMRKGDNNE